MKKETVQAQLLRSILEYGEVSKEDIKPKESVALLTEWVTICVERLDMHDPIGASAAYIYARAISCSYGVGKEHMDVFYEDLLKKDIGIVKGLDVDGITIILLTSTSDMINRSDGFGLEIALRATLCNIVDFEEQITKTIYAGDLIYQELQKGGAVKDDILDQKLAIAFDYYMTNVNDGLAYYNKDVADHVAGVMSNDSLSKFAKCLILFATAYTAQNRYGLGLDLDDLAAVIAEATKEIDGGFEIDFGFAVSKKKSDAEIDDSVVVTPDELSDELGEKASNQLNEILKKLNDSEEK